MRMAREEEQERNGEGRWRPLGLEEPSGLSVSLYLIGRPVSAWTTTKQDQWRRTRGQIRRRHMALASSHNRRPSPSRALPPSHRPSHLLPFSLLSLKGWLAEDVAP